MPVADAAYFINQQSDIFALKSDSRQMYDQGLALNMVLQAISIGFVSGCIPKKFDNLQDRSIITQ